jgi:hypothetical protein
MDLLDSSRLNRITSTIIAPTPLIAANFILLGQVITIIGPQFSRLPPRLCEYDRVMRVLVY